MHIIIQEIEQRCSLFIWSNSMGISTPAYMLDWGWLRIGPPYIYVNIDPVIVHLGPLALRWYGLMYVVGIIMGLWIIRGYTERKGVDQDMVYRVLWWCIAAGLIGGRLYFVIQQPNLVDYYLKNPIHIIATWEGGMAFYGAIFLVIPTLIWRARVERINPLVLVDAGVLFAAAGQIFGRIGNLINGDIIGYVSTLPWSTVYQNPDSWACLRPETCNVPVQPAAGYELLINLVLLATMLFLARRVRRPGVLMLVYLYSYAITQFLIFFTRANDIVSFLGIDAGLKQAQWTSLVVLVALLPLTYWLIRFSKPVPAGAVAATYGISQKPAPVEAGTVTNIVEVPEQARANTTLVSEEKPTVIAAHEVEILPEESAKQLSEKRKDEIAAQPTIVPPPDDEDKIAEQPTIIPSPTDKNEIAEQPTIVPPPDDEAPNTSSDEPASEPSPTNEEVQTEPDDTSDEPASTDEATERENKQSEDEQTTLNASQEAQQSEKPVEDEVKEEVPAEASVPTGKEAK
jgi:phosphatidylglycerol:prolipoprotein diacylglycerol transferase